MTSCATLYYTIEYIDNLIFMCTGHLLIAGVSRGKGQDLFLRAFYESLQVIKQKKLQVPAMHAVVVGSDMNAQTKFETELRTFVLEKSIQDRVHFVNKTLTVAPYLAAIDVLVQNSQVPYMALVKVNLDISLPYKFLIIYFVPSLTFLGLQIFDGINIAIDHVKLEIFFM